MLPTVMPGDTLAIERTSASGVSVGDIVLFSRDRRFFVHRVVALSDTPARIVTRGDAMPVPDMPISETDLLGRVTSIVRNGISIQPRRSLRLSERVIASLVRRSTFAARVTLYLWGLLQGPRQSRGQASEIQLSVL